MEIGITTGSFWPKSTLEAINILSSFDISGIEVTLQTNEFSLDFDRNVGLSLFRKIKNQVLKSKMKIISVHAPHFLDEQSFSNEAKEKILNKSIEVCSLLGGSVFVFHPVHIFKTYEDAQKFILKQKPLEEVLLDKFRNILSRMYDLKIIPTLENIRTFSTEKFFNDPDNMGYFLKEISSPAFGITLDLVHSQLAGNTQEFIKKLGYKIVHIHVADVDENKRRVPPGSGVIDWPSLLVSIQKTSASNLVLELIAAKQIEISSALEILNI